MPAGNSYRNKEPLRGLSGPEKVGALLLALGRSRASSILKKFAPEELSIILRSADAMSTITSLELEQIVAEFESCLEKGAPFVGRPDDVKQLVASAISESRSADENQPGAPLEGLWPRLTSLRNKALMSFLRTQHPQIMAYVLQKIDGDRSAALLQDLPPDERNEIVGRMLGLQEVQAAVSDALEASVQVELFDSDASASAQRMTMAGILSNLDHKQSSEVLEHLAEYRPTDAAAIQKLIFKFEDVDRLPTKALTTIMEGMPVERIVIALQGMPESLTNTVLATLSPRARRMAEAELKAGTNASPSDLAASRRAIVEAVLKLVADGTLELPGRASSQ